MEITYTIRVEFTALDSLVEYLREQQKLDVIAAGIREVTERLLNSQTQLEAATQKEGEIHG